MAALQAERQTVAGRLDAIDLAIDSLGRLTASTKAPTRKATKRSATVVKRAPVAESGDAHERRMVLLDLIRKAGAAGLTTAELRQRGPRMKPGDRQNALQRLKQSGDIKRQGNTWLYQSKVGE